MSTRMGGGGRGGEVAMGGVDRLGLGTGVTWRLDGDSEAHMVICRGT